MSHYRRIAYFTLLLTLLLPALVLAQGTPEEALERAEAALEDNDLDAAVQAFTAAIVLNPELTEAFVGRGDVYNDLGQFRRAFSDFDRAVQLDEESADAYRGRGVAGLNLGEVDDARSDLETSIELDPDNPAGYVELGLWHLAVEGDIVTAQAAIREAIERDPEYAEAYYINALVLQSQGQAEAAIDSFGAAIEIEPDNTEFLSARANLYESLGDYDNAVDDMTAVIEIDPEDSSPYLNRGFYIFSSGDLEGAGPDYYEWMIREEVERFEEDTIEDGDTERLEMERGFVYTFPFEVGAGEVLSVNVTAINGDIDPAIVVLDADGEPVMAYDDTIFSFNVGLEMYRLDPGEYTLVVSHAGGGFDGDVALEFILEMEIGNA